MINGQFTLEASANSLAIEQSTTSIMTLSHNQLQIVFNSLSLNEILSMRLLNKHMNEQIKLYLKDYYLPLHFSNFNKEEEKETIENLQKRQLSLNLSTILNKDGIKSLQNLMSTHSELVQNIYSCYNIIGNDIFAYDKGTNQQIFNSQKFEEFCNNFDINQLSTETFEQLTEQVQKINLLVVTPQMRQIALMARTFSQLVMNFQFQTKLKSSKLRLRQYQIIQNAIGRV